MYTSDDCHLNADALQEYTPPIEEVIERRDAPTAGSQSVSNSRNVRRRLTTAESNTPVNASGLPITAEHHLWTTDVTGNRDTADRTNVHVYITFDLFRNMRVNNIESDCDPHSISCSKNPQPLSTVRPKEPSSSRSIRRRLMPASSKEIPEPNSSRSQDDTLSYMDLVSAVRKRPLSAKIPTASGQTVGASRIVRGCLTTDRLGFSVTGGVLPTPSEHHFHTAGITRNRDTVNGTTIRCIELFLSGYLRLIPANLIVFEVCTLIMIRQVLRTSRYSTSYCLPTTVDNTEPCIHVKNPQPLSTVRPKEPSSSRSIRRRLMPASSKEIPEPNSSRSQDDTLSYMDLVTSFGAKVDDSVNKGKGTICFQNLRSNLSLDRLSLPRGRHTQPRHRPIHILDEHNDLVRLFRTARDRCTAGEIPGFKIRLYSKGGVQGYELSASEILGGSVKIIDVFQKL
nr:helitron helicase-like domain-containing protein [Tanacetum cinerariifolium]